MTRFQWFGLATVLVLAWFATAIATHAQGPAAPRAGGVAELRREVSGLALDVLRAEALARELKDEERLLTTAPQAEGEADSRLLLAPEDLWVQTFGNSTPGEGLDGRPLAVLEGLATVQKKIDSYRRDSIEAWTQAEEQSLKFREELAEVESQVGWAMGSKPPRIALSADLVGLGAVAVLGGLALLMHERRDRLRWRLRAVGSRPSLTAVAIVLAFAGAFGASPGTPDDAPGPTRPAPTTAAPNRVAAELAQLRADLQQQLEEKKEANTAADARLATRLEEVRRARAAHALKPETARQKAIVEHAEAVEAQVQKSFRDVRVAARVTSSALEEADRLEAHLKSEHRKLQFFLVGSKDTALRISLIRLGACGLFIFAALVPLALVRRRYRKDRVEQSRICPRCLNKDTLDFAAGSADADDDQTMFRLKYCNHCDYEIRENYISQNRLCFPTVGIRASGKTHWLLMLYDQIKNSNIPVASAIRKIPSREDARFDELVQRLLYAGRKLDATVYNLPHPITFHVNDADPLGPNRSMVNMFDFSGEMRNFDIDTNEFRRRALLCEGFTLFLDPSQVSEGTESIESQIECLTKFAEEMHAIRAWDPLESTCRHASLSIL